MLLYSFNRGDATFGFGEILKICWQAELASVFLYPNTEIYNLDNMLENT